MNKEFIDELVKRAAEKGLSETQIAEFLHDNLNVKSAAEQFDDLVSALLTEQGIATTPKTAAYVEGILKAAVDKGCTDAQAIEITKTALSKTASKFPPMPNNPNAKSAPAADKTAAYAQAFMKRAQEIGYSEGQSLDLYKIAVGEAQPPQAGPSGPGPGAGAPAGLDQIPPELLQQILMLLQQQAQGQGQHPQGGPGAASAGAGGPDAGGLPPELFKQLGAGQQ